MKPGLIAKVVLLVGVPLLLLGGCMSDIVEQDHNIQTFQPVEATMLATNLKKSGDDSEDRSHQGWQTDQIAPAPGCE